MYKKIDKSLLPSVFSDNVLTNLTLVKNVTNQIGSSIDVNIVLDHILSEYGIFISGSTRLYDIDNKPTNLILIKASIDRKFPRENLWILKQMYNYQGIIDVNYFTRNTSDDDAAYHFRFNLLNDECVFFKSRHGAKIKTKSYDTFDDMMDDISLNRRIDSIFRCKKDKHAK